MAPTCSYSSSIVLFTATKNNKGHGFIIEEIQYIYIIGIAFWTSVEDDSTHRRPYEIPPVKSHTPCID